MWTNHQQQEHTNTVIGANDEFLHYMVGGTSQGGTSYYGYNNYMYDLDKEDMIYEQKRNQGVNEAQAYINDYALADKKAILYGGTFYENPNVEYMAETSTALDWITSGATKTDGTTTILDGLLPSNTGREADVIKDNADDLKDVGDNNADWTRLIDVLAAQRDFNGKQAKTQAKFNEAKNKKPIQLTPELGNMRADLTMQKGVQVKIKTMSDSDIREVGDTFIRYGYYLNQLWNIEFSGLCPMTHFCYWKAKEIWVDDRKSSNNKVQKIIKDIFLNGVTVWKHPDEIGLVNPYTNGSDV